jgi:hypothetical protein
MALGLPEAYEDLHRRRPAFRVNKKIFAMLGVAGETTLFPGLADSGMAVLKLDRDDQLNMVAAHEGAVTPTGDYSHHGWTYVHLAELDEAALETLVRLAWAHVAPRRLVR